MALPKRGMHRRLEEEKSRRQSEVNGRIDLTVETLHSVVDEETNGQRDGEASRLAQVRIDALNKAFSSLLQEREFIGKLSSWPWDTSTLRTVVSAVALPIILFVLTNAIDRFLL